MPRTLVPLVVFLSLGPNLLLADDAPWIARGQHGMVASDSPEASQIGADVLAGGGNAFDAAIATSLALAVARPDSTGLGGGGFMVAYIAREKRCIALDFREAAPAAATAERFAQLHAQRGDGPSPTVYGGHAIGVPGQLAGLQEIHKRFATRPLSALIAPALRLAEDGFITDEHHRAACKSTIAAYERWPQLRQRHGRLYQTLLGDGTPPELGSHTKRPDLAMALRLFARHGADEFYQGWIGKAVVQATQAAGGLLTMEDLAAYRVREREPIRGRFGDYEVVSMPPPSSGGICIVEALNVLSAWSRTLQKQPAQMRTDGTFPVYFVNALQHSFADRARWLGDPDFSSIPVKRLTSPASATELVDRNGLKGREFGTAQLPDDGGTAHFCVADKHGNIVAITETINGSFGSLVVAEPYGIILNNQMDDFAANPGKPNLYGLIQGEANAVGPGKRPLSSMSPTIVFKEGRPVLALGGSGGPCIITSVLQVLLNVITFDMPIEKAVSARRLHHQWRPDEVYFDGDPGKDVAAALRRAGHTISDRRKGGIVQAIRFLADGTMVGASDPRKGGRPAAPTADPAGKGAPGSRARQP